MKCKIKQMRKPKVKALARKSETKEIEDTDDEVEQHKQSLLKLKETDPDFYKFLQENDKNLLEFNISDVEDDEDQIKDDEDEEAIHKPGENLEIASDESDFEGEDEIKDERVITLKQLKSWQLDIKTDKSNKTIVTLIKAFDACIKRISNEESEEPVEFKVDGSSVFNGVIQLCVLELGPAIRRFLGLAQGSKQPPHKCKKFQKIKNPLKTYFTDLSKLLTGVSSTNIQTVLLKHLHYMSAMLVSYPHVTKQILKKLIALWGTADDGIRVLAFFCILRITNNHLAGLLDTVLKSMYMTYVKNSKFVTLNSLSSINFMRRSLVEMFALDLNVAYQHVFLYIRQLAIHLRNAITVNKKENIQAVYNWQFINSLKLWGNLLSATPNKPQIESLVYPFVQVCLGTLKLIPTAQYYPLRFHVVQILIDLSKDTGVFIPVIPFLLEVLNTYDFNKKHQKVSMKPLNFTFVLRMSKSQLTENGFKDAVIENVYAQLLEYLSLKSHSIAFPDLSLICSVQIKQFMKKCSNPNYTRKLKQLLEKIEQNSKFIENERKNVALTLGDSKKIDGWESQIENKGTPLSTYFESWNKHYTIKKNKQLTNNEELGKSNLLNFKNNKKIDSKKQNNKDNNVNEDGKVELFPSDSEDESVLDENSEKKSKGKRGKRGGKKFNKKIKFTGKDEDIEISNDNDAEDIVEDINDW